MTLLVTRSASDVRTPTWCMSSTTSVAPHMLACFDMEEIFEPILGVLE